MNTGNYKLALSHASAAQVAVSSTPNLPEATSDRVCPEPIGFSQS